MWNEARRLDTLFPQGRDLFSAGSAVDYSHGRRAAGFPTQDLPIARAPSFVAWSDASVTNYEVRRASLSDADGLLRLGSSERGC